MARPLQMRWMIAAGVTLVAVVVVVAAVLTAGDDDPVGAAGPAGEVSATVEATVTGDAGVPDAPGAPGASAPADAGTPGGPPPVTGSPAAPTPADDAQAPNAPAAPQSALATVTVPPQRTLSMIDSDKATPESRYEVTFDVYGYGPPGGAGSLVILVRQSDPVRTVEQPYDFTGRNVLVRLSPTGSGAVNVGGRYTGVVTLKPNGSVLVPVLSDVRSGS